MVRLVEQVEPERRQLGEDSSLVRNAAGKHPIERADAIRADQKEPISEVVHIADLAATDGYAGDRSLQDYRTSHGLIPPDFFFFGQGRGRIGRPRAAWKSSEYTSRTGFQPAAGLDSLEGFLDDLLPEAITLLRAPGRLFQFGKLAGRGIEHRHVGQFGRQIFPAPQVDQVGVGNPEVQA